MNVFRLSPKKYEDGGERESHPPSHEKKMAGDDQQRKTGNSGTVMRISPGGKSVAVAIGRYAGFSKRNGCGGSKTGKKWWNAFG